jgi:hypothetical protein
VRCALLALQILVVALAAVLALAPLPPSLVERYYADWFYPALQARLTPWSNLSGVALFDILIACFGVGLLVAWIRWTRRVVRDRTPRPLLRGLVVTITAAAIGVLWFQAAWGLNYARDPLEQAIGYDASRVTPEALRSLADRATLEVNRTHAAGHASGFSAAEAMPAALVTAIHAVERRFGRPHATVPSRPKRTLLAWFFRWSGTDGLHAPFLLETLLNPDLTPPERPAVLAHEWAHLSGYASEDDASFVGLLAALRADPGSRYSAWLALFHHAVSQLPLPQQRELVARLHDGPRADRRAIAARLEARVDVVARASWETYDRYLRAQGVAEGVESYSRVVNLMIGSGALEWPE